jgi:hypothetical protein
MLVIGKCIAKRRAAHIADADATVGSSLKQIVIVTQAQLFEATARCPVQDFRQGHNHTARQVILGKLQSSYDLNSPCIVPRVTKAIRGRQDHNIDKHIQR